MIDMNKKYTYKNGEAARILCTDRPFAGNLVVLSMRPNGAIVQSTIDGKVQCYNSEYDLVEAWEPKEGEVVYMWDSIMEPIAVHIRRFKCMNDNHYTDTRRVEFNYCAPFTGTLPEVFKGL